MFKFNKKSWFGEILVDNKSIYYKNIYNFYMSTCKECNIHDIKIIVKILNYS